MYKSSPLRSSDSWEFSEQSISSYATKLNNQNYPVTFFSVPESAKHHNILFNKLITAGNEVGLHFHNNSFKENYLEPEKYKTIGYYSSELQYTMLNDAYQMFNKSMGFYPKSFRPGYFSLNNKSYSILSKIGLSCGSTSLPGRKIKKYSADWVGKRRDIHKVNTKDKKIAGELDFIDVPVTSNLNFMGKVSKHGDVRIEKIKNMGNAKHLEKAIKQHLLYQIKMRSKMLHLCFFTHNTNDFMKNSPISIEDYIQIVERSVKDMNLQGIGSNISNIRNKYLRI